MSLIEALLQTIVMKQDQILERLNQTQQQTPDPKTVQKNTGGKTNSTFKPQHIAVAQEIYNIINATTPTKMPNMKQWANDIRKLNEIDKVEIHRMLEVFKIANKDDFWSMNVRSPKKLRKHWDRLSVLRLKSLGLNSKKDTRESLDYFKGKQW